MNHPSPYFPETVWTRIVQATDRNSEDYKESLKFLVSRYWEPVFRYICVVWGRSEEDSADLAQEFFTSHLERDILSGASPEKGMFRSFLKVSLRHFLIDVKRREAAQKRGGGSPQVSLDIIGKEGFEDKRTAEPGRLFDKEWANTIISLAFRELKDTLTRQNKAQYFRAFELYYFSAPDSDGHAEYESVSEELGMTKRRVKTALRTCRSLIKRIITAEIRNYVTDESGVNDELKYILSFWA